MRSLLRGLVASVLLAPFALLATRDTPPPAAQPVAEVPKLSMPGGSFLTNQGQWPPESLYIARYSGADVHIHRDGWSVATRQASFRMSFARGLPEEVRPLDQTPVLSSFFFGSDPSAWRTSVPSFARVRFVNVWPNVDVVCYTRDGHFEYDVLVLPGGRLENVAFEIDPGPDGDVRLTSSGALELASAGATRFTHTPPVTYSVSPAGKATHLLCHPLLRTQTQLHFVAERPSADDTLVIDPGITWSTYLGGTLFDSCSAIQRDPQGRTVVAGGTTSINFPTTSGAYSSRNSGAGDIFVAVLDSTQVGSQQLVYATYVGGQGNDSVSTLTIDSAGLLYLGGNTTSTDFPVTPTAYDGTYNGNVDAFVSVIDYTQQGPRQLAYSSFFGGAGLDTITASQVSSSQMLSLCGATTSGDLPISLNAYDGNANGREDAFVAQLDMQKSGLQQLSYSTYIGGSQSDTANALFVSSSGILTIAGQSYVTTSSPTFPTTPGSFSGTNSGLWDAFVSQLNPGTPPGQQLVYSTLLGGESDEYGTCVHVGSTGVITVGGWTSSSYFPTTQLALSRARSGGKDVFVTRLDPAQAFTAQLRYSTYIGGASDDVSAALHVNQSGVITIAGQTFSYSYPTTRGAWARTSNGGSEGIVSRIDPERGVLLYSTFVEGTNNESILGLVSDGLGGLLFCGKTDSPNFPTTPGCYDPTPNGLEDAFVSALDLLPTGAVRIGAGKYGCSGLVDITVSSMPFVGNNTFSVLCYNAPALTSGFAAIGTAALSTPIDVLGAPLWLDLSQPSIVLIVPTDARGASELRIPIPSNSSLAGTRLYAQFLWGEATSPAPCPPLGLSASGALQILIHP